MAHWKRRPSEALGPTKPAVLPTEEERDVGKTLRKARTMVFKGNKLVRVLDRRRG